MRLPTMETLLTLANTCNQIYQNEVLPEKWGHKTRIKDIKKFLLQIKKMLTPARRELETARAGVAVAPPEKKPVKRTAKTAKLVNPVSQDDDDLFL